MVERRLTGMIAAAAVLIVLFIFWDAFRPTRRPVDAAADGPMRIAEPPPIPAPPPQATSPAQGATPTTTSQGTAVPAGPNGREPSYMELMARSETRRRIRSSGSTTYISVVATHEVGHLLGLDHSKDSTDIMFPTAKVRDLSDRDVRTVLFLYQLTPGSLR